jgi:heat shock protein HslJ
MKFSHLLFAAVLACCLAACHTKKTCTETLNPACICTEQYEPVCGCNDKTYGNACMAECAGIKTYTKGECPPQNSNALENPQWRLTLFAVGPQPKAIPDNIAIRLRFENGRLEGYGGCNSIGGNYTLKNRHLMTTGLVSTKMFCAEAMPYETQFLQMLEKSQAYNINGNTLEIQCGDMGNLVFQQH